VTAKANVREAIERVARRLGNTPTICRKCYVHPEVLDSYLDGGLALDIERRAAAELDGDLEHLRVEEVAVLAFLRRRLRRQAAKARTPRRATPPAAARAA
jgi:DNA topoisomerase-1